MVTAVSVSISYSRTIPSPPRHLPAPPLPCRSRSDEADRQVVLERFDRRVARVAHVRVHAADAVETRPCAHAAADGFVVGKRPAVARIDAAKRDIVHRALAGSGDAIRQRRASAPRTTSVMRCEVSTFPPATAEGRRALTIVPAGAISRTAPRNASVVEHIVIDQAAEPIQTWPTT